MKGRIIDLDERLIEITEQGRGHLPVGAQVNFVTTPEELEILLGNYVIFAQGVEVSFGLEAAESMEFYLERRLQILLQLSQWRDSGGVVITGVAGFYTPGQKNEDATGKLSLRRKLVKAWNGFLNRV